MCLVCVWPGYIVHYIHYDKQGYVLVHMYVKSQLINNLIKSYSHTHIHTHPSRAPGGQTHITPHSYHAQGSCKYEKILYTVLRTNISAGQKKKLPVKQPPLYACHLTPSSNSPLSGSPNQRVHNNINLNSFIRPFSYMYL